MSFPKPGHYAVPTNVPPTQIDYVTPNKPYAIYPSPNGTKSCITVDNNVEIAFPSPYDYQSNAPYGDGFQLFGITWKVVHPKDMTHQQSKFLEPDELRKSQETLTKKPPQARDSAAHGRINELTERVEELEKNQLQTIHQSIVNHNPKFFRDKYMQKPPRVWPLPGDKYHWINSEGEILDAIWRKSKSDFNRQNFLGIFRTYEAARDQVEELKAHHQSPTPSNSPARKRKHTLSPADGWPQLEDIYFWVTPERNVLMDYWKDSPLDHQRDHLYGIYPTRWAAEKAWGLLTLE